MNIIKSKEIGNDQELIIISHISLSSPKGKERNVNIN